MKLFFEKSLTVCKHIRETPKTESFDFNLLTITLSRQQPTLNIYFFIIISQKIRLVFHLNSFPSITVKFSFADMYTRRHP